MTDINTAAETFAGQWVKMASKEDGVIEGQVLAFEQRPMTFEGAPLTNRKTGAQRWEWVFTVKEDGGDTVKFSVKESGQRAIAAAIKEAGVTAKNGDRLKIAVSADKVDERSQPTYQARWTATELSIPAVEDEEAPF